ncbi:hypothetical protein [Dyella sp. 2HG41-7]|uniref:hypothetical protein n=1 Tax=Dyella sp. 2HG41-7 TaxID=2883239 RepID=UPI001F2F6281|nr:hypothetical protein [Dyella sp. 2HG41-7]
MSYPKQLNPLPGGSTSLKNITGPTLCKAVLGRVWTVSVIVAGSAPGSVYDSNSLSGLSTANQIGTVPNTVGPASMGGFRVNTGIVLVPGTGQTLAIAFT